MDEELLRRVAGMLNLDRTAIVDASWLVNGPPWIGVLLEVPRRSSRSGPGVVDADIGIAGLYPPGSTESLEVRAFFPLGGSTAEDPVTGSLNAALAQWLLGSGRLTAPYVAPAGHRPRTLGSGAHHRSQ